MAYTATSNIQAHIVAELLESNGIEAYVSEDETGVSLWAFGTINQFHRPDVWVDESSADRARGLIGEFEQKQRDRENAQPGTGQIDAVCESCGKSSKYPDSMKGTTQSCSHCRSYVDVGEFEWDE